MFADPIVQAVMARDGVTRQELEGLIVTVRHKTHAPHRSATPRCQPKGRAPYCREPRTEVSCAEVACAAA
tara:strand:+ start:379 stop:588 length:210 start_codon:yes stop_codon:yes gene_type:complete